MCSADIFLGLIAILFPPLPVWVKRGICSADSLINILLCVLGYVPGLLHAWYVIAKFPEPPYEYESLPQFQDGEEGRVTYVFVHGSSDDNNRQPRQPKPQGPHGGMNYGTTGTGNQAPAQSQGQGASAASNSQGDSQNQGGIPPSYASVVAGDNKVQSHN